MSTSEVVHATAPNLSATDLAEYLLDLGGALLSYGCATHRLEAVLRQIAALEGHQAEVFAVPTGLFLTLTPPGGAPIVRMNRVAVWGTDLGRLAQLDRLLNDVLFDKLTLAQARRLLDRIEARPPSYPLVLRWLSFAAAAGGAAIFFRGGVAEACVAGVGGLLFGVLRSLLGRSARAGLLQDFLGAVLAALVAWGATTLQPTLSRQVLVLSVVIILIPGMALTTGLAELAHKNLVSGAAKLMEAMMSFLFLVFGIAVVVGAERLLGLHPTSAPPPVPPGVVVAAVALVVASLAFCVILAVPPALVPGAVLAGGVGWITSTVFVRHVPPSMAAFAASLSVALLANGLARLRRRPAQVFLVPGLVLLVPGSFGFLSLEAFLRGEFLGGAAKAFEMFLTAAAIVTGLLVANVALPARKLL